MAAVRIAGAAGAARQVTGGPNWPGGTAPPERVFDGNPATYWAGDPEADRWQLDLDLGEVQQVPAITIVYVDERHRAREATADLSVDGTTWQPLGALPAAVRSCQPVGQPARYLRLCFAGKAKDGQPAIREICFTVETAEPQSVTQDIEYPSRADGTMQPARYFSPDSPAPVPLVVGLHTWSGDYRQHYLPGIEAWCAKQGWAYIHPNFRGPNWTPQACGSDLVVADILSAVEFVQRTRAVDASRIYLVGGSGGGYHALLMAGRAPDLWAGISAWVPISDLAAWYRECRAVGSGYADHIVKSCGGAPGTSPEVDAQVRYRSPLTHLAGARTVPLDINAGIHDGHRGSVPISHSLLAFNAVAAPEDRISLADIAWMTEHETVPESLRDPTLQDPSYGMWTPLFRRQSGTVRVTLFAGGHEIVEAAASQWLQHQRRLALGPVALPQ